jgi:3-(3-hydroxy-phenyl)propionate hydroxylase
MHKQPDDIWRVDYQLLDDQDPEAELREDRVRDRIQRQLDMVGEAAPWQLDWHSLYKAHCLCLDRYRHGRVLFVGDAAHLVPIFGVRGLNSGFADANNLGWKLAYVLRGLAGDGLLDSFGDERRAATLEIFREAGKSTRFMTPPSRGYALLREAALALSLDAHWPRGLINPRQSAPYDYVDSPLNSDPEAEAGFSGGPRRGAPLRNVRLDDLDGRPSYLLDHLGCGCTGLYFAGAEAVPEADRRVLLGLQQGRVPFQALVVAAAPPGDPGLPVLLDSAGRAMAAYDAGPGTCYLARPDAHVAARWKRLPPERLAAALRRATGAVS